MKRGIPDSKKNGGPNASWRCPECGERRSNIIDSRPSNLGPRRTRVCVACGFRTSTIEVPRSIAEFVHAANYQAPTFKGPDLRELTPAEATMLAAWKRDVAAVVAGEME